MDPVPWSLRVPDPTSQTLYVQSCLDRLARGDETARAELFERTCERLSTLAHKMLRSYPRVRRWEETGDVLQNAILRLDRALKQVTVATPRDYFRLAALNVRRELLDMAKHYYGPQGGGAKHATHAPDARSSAQGGLAHDPGAESTAEPGRLAAWTEFHEQIEHLPAEEREVFDLLWYQELSQAEAAALLDVSERTIKRRWQSARIMLHDALKGEIPE
jgi:RNA polymerase sigma-70 factor (ECF subfamily)